MAQQIITIGGGGFSNGTELGLDSYVLQQSNTHRPKIGFIGTASGDDTRYVVRFFSRFSKLDCEPSALSLFGRVQNLEDWILSQDIIFVGGGNTKSMLGVWSCWGIPSILNTALNNGTILCGVSAGAICWFESGITDSIDSSLTALAGLGFLNGSCCPHYSAEPERKPVYERLVASKEIAGGIAIDDGAAVHWINGEPKKIVSGKNGASAYSVKMHDSILKTKKIKSAKIINVQTT
ncbi:MAG: Type 1 glutamine amidotransferase-like domain-containing protein [Pseudomonadales bacterium]|nr:Type 1 glutamine amidotransferase-like domain-containing protein [Pseudomonadales bacterium]